MAIALAALAAVAPRSAPAQVPVPPLTGWVVDLTGTLSGATVARLENSLAALEAKKGSQIAVLMVPTTQPEDIEQFGIRVAEAWKLGRKGVDDGAILLVAKNDRRVRIEVGYGLEGALPDAIANRIIDETITPRFRSGDFDGGVEAGVARMIAVVSGEPLPPPERHWNAERRDTLRNLFPMLFAIVFVASGVLRAMFGRLFGSLAVAAAAGGLAFALSDLLAIGLGAGVLAFGFSMLLGAMRGWSNGGGWGGLGGFGGGLGGGFGGGFGGGGGGGFSGGGGGFGGGGASGSW
ncbi:MAG: YgcG family protein [Gammaproteobacteria bacterium]|nr:YgcG family protein [Gammaproteobacteria bacterium]